jgi:hypothetical protein
MNELVAHLEHVNYPLVEPSSDDLFLHMRLVVLGLPGLDLTFLS